uniref:Uncharacterized protein n=1 Tax=Biomphalaria glabrata TaxID=6526 RepID=A0A2C9KVI1_BIOGL
YQDDIAELNEIAKHRPRSTLVLGIAQENRQIRELQQENRELQAALEEHQSALELIMQKYREHTVKLIQSYPLEKVDSFPYLGSILDETGETDVDVKARMQKQGLPSYSFNSK